MRLFLRTLSIAMLCGILTCPMIEARGRNNGGNNEPQRTQQSRGSQNNRGTQNNRGSQPGKGQNKSQVNKSNMQQAQKQHVQNNNNLRPNNGNNHNGGQGGNNKPNHNGGNHNNGNHNNGNHNNGNHNGGNHNGGNHNGGNYNGGHPGNNGNHYGNPPGNHHNHGVHYGVPNRPMMPHPRPYAVPRPPYGWVYNGGGPLINTILGITIGTAINTTLNLLINQGYNVIGYVDDAIYITDAMQLNMLWPNATLYYGPYGGLMGSEFYYSTPYYDMNRYNMAYNRLYNAYGPPVSSIGLAGGGIQTTWWGANGAYVQLQFQGGVANNGQSRFYTTLSFGN